ncbi:MAG: hypothetical protein JSS50_00785 [Proteobacteria bacterium]|nr:hypothetical protein [Pseudomonadota bacterium]
MTATQCRNLLYDVLHNPGLYDLKNCMTVNSIKSGFNRAFYNIDIKQNYQEFDGDDVIHFLMRNIRFSGIKPEEHHYYSEVWFIIFGTFIQTNYSALKTHSIETEIIKTSIAVDYAPLTDLMLATIKGGLINMDNQQIILLYLDTSTYNNAASAQLKQFIVEKMLWDQTLLLQLNTILRQSMSDAVVDQLIYSIAHNGAAFAKQLLHGLWERYYKQPYNNDSTANQFIEELFSVYSTKLHDLDNYQTILIEKILEIVENSVPHARTMFMDFILAHDSLLAFEDFLAMPGNRTYGMQWLAKIATQLDLQTAQLSLIRTNCSKIFGHHDIEQAILNFSAKNHDYNVLASFLANNPNDRLSTLDTAITHHMDEAIIQICHSFSQAEITINASLGESLLINYIQYGDNPTVMAQIIKTFGVQVDYQLVLEVWSSTNFISLANKEISVQHLIQQQLGHLHELYNATPVTEYMADLLAAAIMGDEVTASGNLPLVDAYIAVASQYIDRNELWNKALIRLIQYSDYGLYQKLELLSDSYANNIDFANIMQQIGADTQVYQGLYEAFSKEFIPQAMQYIQSLDNATAADIRDKLVHAVHNEIVEVAQCMEYSGYNNIMDEMLYTLQYFSESEQEYILGDLVPDYCTT